MILLHIEYPVCPWRSALAFQAVRRQMVDAAYAAGAVIPYKQPVQLHVLHVGIRQKPKPTMVWSPHLHLAEPLSEVIRAGNGVLWHQERFIVDARCQKVNVPRGFPLGVYIGVQPMGGINDELTTFMPIAGQVWSMLPVEAEPGAISGELDPEADEGVDGPA